MTTDFGAAFVAALAGRSADALRAALSPQFAGKANGRPLDREAQVRLVESMWTGFPDGRFTCDAVGGSGRQVLTWTLAGTHGGDYLGIPATGSAVTLSGFTIAVWNATGITSLDWKWDTKAFARQVMGAEDLEGALPKPPQHRPDPSVRWAREEQRRRRGQGGGKKPKRGPGQDPQRQGKGRTKPRAPAARRPTAAAATETPQGGTPEPPGPAAQAPPADSAPPADPQVAGGPADGAP